MSKKHHTKSENIESNHSSRRTFLKWLALGGVLGTTSTAGTILKLFENASNINIDFSVDSKNLLNKEEIELITSLIKGYTGLYGKGMDKIIVSVSDHSSQSQTLANGNKVTVLEDASPGLINIDLSVLRNTDISQKTSEILKIFDHSMGHANQNSSIIEFPNGGLSLSDGSLAYGIEGFSILVKTQDKERTAFRKIEEGVCEALAKGFDQHYTVNSHNYFAVGYLTQRLLDLNPSINIQHLAKLIQTGNLLEFIRIILHKNSVSNLTTQNIEQVMTLYQNAWNLGDDLSDKSALTNGVDRLVSQLDTLSITPSELIYNTHNLNP